MHVILNLEWFAILLQAKVFSHNDDSDSDYDDFTDDEEFQAPIDDIDAFVFFSDAMKGWSILLLYFSTLEILLQ